MESDIGLQRLTRANELMYCSAQYNENNIIIHKKQNQIYGELHNLQIESECVYCKNKDKPIDILYLIISKYDYFVTSTKKSFYQQF